MTTTVAALSQKRLQTAIVIGISLLIHVHHMFAAVCLVPPTQKHSNGFQAAVNKSGTVGHGALRGLQLPSSFVRLRLCLMCIHVFHQFLSSLSFKTKQIYQPDLNASFAVRASLLGHIQFSSISLHQKVPLCYQLMHSQTKETCRKSVPSYVTTTRLVLMS